MRIRRYFSIVVTYFSIFTLIFTFSYLYRLFADVGMLITPESMSQHQSVVDKYFTARKAWMTSNLGAYLFKYYNTRKPPTYVVKETPKRGYYTILIWMHWPWLKHRHAYHYGNYSNRDPLLGCSVSNCKFEENNDISLSTADAVVVYIQKGYLPDTKSRKPFQRWIFWTDESPEHTFSLAKKENIPTLQKLAGMFNWSMTYRSDSDVPIPYGRTVPLPYPKLNDMTVQDLKELVPYWDNKRTDILAVNIMSRCEGFRIRFVNKLRRFMNVDMFGKCAETENHKRRCPGHYAKDCPVISEYLFYIVMENSNCRQFISEKIFHHAYSKGAIPIIMGTPLEDCIKLLPPNSFIHMENFVSVKHLAREIQVISDDVERLLSYHAWRNNFETVEEHGFLGTRSLVMCRLCEAMNYNDRSVKVYKLDDIHLYLDRAKSCFRNRDWV